MKSFGEFLYGAFIIASSALVFAYALLGGL